MSGPLPCSRASRFESSRTLRSLRVRNFRLFFGGQLVSQTGTWMQAVALTWAVIEAGGGGVELGITTAAQFGPVLILGAWSGLLSDRRNTHRLIIAIQVAFIAVAIILSVVSFAGPMSLGTIYALSLLFGLVNAFDNPARRAFIGELVGPDDLVNAVGLNTTLMTASRIVGPTLAGALISGAGVEWCFLVNALTYPAVLVALFAMDSRQFAMAEKVPKSPGQLREGWHYVISRPELRIPVIILVVVTTLVHQFELTLPLLAEETFHGSAGTFTLLYTTLSAGALLGGLLLARRTETNLSNVNAGVWQMGAAMLVLGLAPNVWVAALATIPAGLAAITVISGSNTIVQLRTAAHMRGRAVAILSIVFVGGRPIGGPIVGVISAAFGPRAGILLGAGACAAIGTWTSRVTRHSRGERRQAKRSTTVVVP